MSTHKVTTLKQHIRAGRVYRRANLAPHSTAIDRELAYLVSSGDLNKVGAGLYYAPAYSRFGPLPANDKALVTAFLGTGDFLLFSRNEYNSLNLGLTQLYNQLIVYNHKRHGAFNLGNKKFYFKRPACGFPKKLSKAYLLIDLLNHHKELNEDVDKLWLNITNTFSPQLLQQAKKLASSYGKIATKKLFEGSNV